MTNPPAPHFESVEVSTAVMAGLAIEADKLAQSAEHLRGTYRWSRQLRVIGVLGLMVLVLNAALLVLLLRVAHSNQANGKAIRSCTTPGGACYEHGQQTTGTAVKNIVTAVNAHSDFVIVTTIACTQQRPQPDLVACLRSHGVTP